MKAQRPDQRKFETFIAPLEAIDSLLESFCTSNGFTLDRNLYRTPCRVLRTGDNPVYIIDIFLIKNWYTSEFSDRLKYTVACCAYYSPASDPKHKWKVGVELLKNVQFQTIQKRLEEQLPIALEKFRRWKPNVIKKEGIKIPNYEHLFRDELHEGDDSAQ